jgi:hypothetical protein
MPALQPTLRLGCAAFVLFSVLIGVHGPTPVQADIIPEWSSPGVLVPGVGDHRVRIVSAQVDIRLVERDDAVIAVVHASYALLNEGPDREMPIGFLTPLLAPGPQFADVDPATLRAWSGEQELGVQTGEIDVNLPRLQAVEVPWLYWDVAFPEGSVTPFEVSYEQQLTMYWWAEDARPPFALLTYDLDFASLWHGPVGAVTVSVSAGDGGLLFDDARLHNAGPTLEDGRFVGPAPYPPEAHLPERATDAAPDRLVWRYREVEPDWRLGAVYVRHEVRERIEAAEAALVAPTPTAQEYLDGVAAIRELIGPDGYLMPAPLLVRYPELAREWAWRATELAPQRADAWEAAGWIEFWFPGWWDGLTCWPTRGSAALQRASALGSTEATELLEYLEPWIAENVLEPETMLRPCSGPPDATLLRHRQSPLVMRKALSIALQARRNALERQDRDWLDRIYADGALDRVRSEADDLQTRGGSRLVITRYPGVESISLDSAETATLIVRYLTVSDTLLDERGMVISQEVERPHLERWRLRLVDETWRVVAIEPVGAPTPAVARPDAARR